MNARPLRIAILSHSTNPRGGVVHALALGEALTDLGHDVVVHAPDAKGQGFFRKTRCRTVCIAATATSADMTEMVEQRVAEYVTYFESAENREFEVFHAHDGISGNALATLNERGLIPGFARTVHHIDTFTDPRLNVLQERAITTATRHFVVSRLWKREMRDRYELDATVVGNGVDIARFSGRQPVRENRLRQRFAVGPGPVFLAIGGIEERKNTIRILEAFCDVRAVHQTAQLIIAGGASLLDHGTYQERFAVQLFKSALPTSAVIRTGPVADEDLPALYHLADALVFPSVKECFGLVVLEALASGIPAVVPHIEPFTDYLGSDTCLWCNPTDTRSITDAMISSLNIALRPKLVAQGRALAGRHTWEANAEAHLPIYYTLLEPADA